MNYPMAGPGYGQRPSGRFACNRPAQALKYSSPISAATGTRSRKYSDQKPDILNHNIESVPRMYKTVRPQAKYRRSLELLKIAKAQGFVTKTGMMLGIGEEIHEIDSVLDDLVSIGCDILTLGQYLQPTAQHLPVMRWVHPDEFAMWKVKGEERGIRHVESGPLVRSSYHAEKQVHAERRA